MTNGMRTIVVDKVASVTQACGLSHEVRVSTDIPAEEGVVVAVEVRQTQRSSSLRKTQSYAFIAQGHYAKD